MNNLQIAFPEKTEAERTVISRKFYRHLTDTFIETIKMISLSEKKFMKMCEMEMGEVVALANKGINIQFQIGRAHV